jgi:hypothetical protein
MRFEKTLQNLADKKRLHEWVDNLPEGVTGHIVVQLPGEDVDKSTVRFTEIGSETLAETVYLAQSVIHWIFSEMRT